MNAFAGSHRRRFYLAGDLVEGWENPDARFRVDMEACHEYVERSEWIALFNALVLSGSNEGADLPAS